MPIRSFNYTGRKRIRREEVELRLGQLVDKTVIFDADIKLNSNHGLPDEAAVCIEAYRGSSAGWMRFPFGTVSALKLPDDRRLTGFDGPEGILFRVKVTSPTTEQGLILAEADAIHPRTPEEEEHARQPLLPVESDKSLEDRIWRLDFKSGPRLLVNSSLGDWREVVLDSVFKSLVLPAVLEQVLIRILRVEKYQDDEDQDDGSTDWRSQWLRFIRTLPSIDELPDIEDEDAVDEWIESSVGAFCRKQHMFARYDEYWNGGGK